jgi:hypothetical protein
MEKNVLQHLKNVATFYKMLKKIVGGKMLAENVD